MENREQNDNLDEEIVKESIQISRWAVFAAIFGIAVIMILYVDNVFRVDDIYSKIQKVKKKREYYSNTNDILRTRLNYLQSPERIMKVAEKRLGMIKIKEVPEVLPEDD